MFSIVFSSVVSHGPGQVMISHLFSTACICIHIHAAPGAIHGQLFYVSTYLSCRRPCPHLTCRRLPPYLICCHLFRNSIRNVLLLVFLFPSPFRSSYERRFVGQYLLFRMKSRLPSSNNIRIPFGGIWIPHMPIMALLSYLRQRTNNRTEIGLRGGEI